MNCEDIAMNFLVSHITRKPPIKVGKAMREGWHGNKGGLAWQQEGGWHGNRGGLAACLCQGVAGVVS